MSPHVLSLSAPQVRGGTLDTDFDLDLNLGLVLDLVLSSSVVTHSAMTTDVQSTAMMSPGGLDHRAPGAKGIGNISFTPWTLTAAW